MVHTDQLAVAPSPTNLNRSSRNGTTVSTATMTSPVTSVDRSQELAAHKAAEEQRAAEQERAAETKQGELNRLSAEVGGGAGRGR